MASGKAALLKWCQQCTAGYDGVHVVNFTTSWGDGLAFCALLHCFHPELIPFDELIKENKERNLELAFMKAEILGIPALLDVEDIVMLPKPEPFSIMTYLSQFFHFFKNAAPAVSSNKMTRGIVPPISSHESPERQKCLSPRPLSSGGPTRLESKQCASCGLDLKGETAEASGNLYHKACLRCSRCKAALTEKLISRDGQPFCYPCSLASRVRKQSESGSKIADVVGMLSCQMKAADGRKRAGSFSDVSCNVAGDDTDPKSAFATIAAAPSTHNEPTVIRPQEEAETASHSTLSSADDVKERPVNSSPETDGQASKMSPRRQANLLVEGTESSVESSEAVEMTLLDELSEPVESPVPAPRMESTTPERAADDASAQPNIKEEIITSFIWEEKVTNLSGYLRFIEGKASRESDSRRRSIHRGMMKVAGSLKGKSWQKRFFIVKNGNLLYYKSRDTVSSELDSMGCLALTDCEHVAPDKDKSDIFILQAEGRQFMLQAGSEAERDIWLIGLYKAINSTWRGKEEPVEADVRPDMQIKRGYMQMKHKKKWVKRWIVLRNGFLLVYKSTESSQQKARVALYECTLEELVGENDAWTAFQVQAHSGDTIYLKANNQEEMMLWINALLVEKLHIEETISAISV